MIDFGDDGSDGDSNGLVSSSLLATQQSAASSFDYSNAPLGSHVPVVAPATLVSASLARGGRNGAGPIASATVGSGSATLLTETAKSRMMASAAAGGVAASPRRPATAASLTSNPPPPPLSTNLPAALSGALAMTAPPASASPRRRGGSARPFGGGAAGIGVAPSGAAAVLPPTLPTSNSSSSHTTSQTARVAGGGGSSFSLPAATPARPSTISLTGKGWRRKHFDGAC